MVERHPSGFGHSDNCLQAAGGFSDEMKFWWYIEWQQEIQKQTCCFVKNNKEGKLISINVLEYAALIINYVGDTDYYRQHTTSADPYPVIRLYANNTTAKAWAKMKQCKSSMIGCTLS